MKRGNMKKLGALVAIFLLMFTYLLPLGEVVDIKAALFDDFSTVFIDNKESDLDDYYINNTGTSLISTYKLKASDEEKVITYSFPSGIDITNIPEINAETGLSDVKQESDSSGGTNVYLTYSPDSSGINFSTSISFNINAKMFYSTQTYTIQSSLKYLSDGTEDTSENTITIHDYASNSYVLNQIRGDYDLVVLDSYMPYELYSVYRGEYLPLRSTGFEMEFSNVQVNLGEILVDVNGTGDYKSINELGALEYVSVQDSTAYVYDDQTGIITYNDYKITGDAIHKFFDIKFDSTFFNTDSKIKMTDAIYSSTIKENYIADAPTKWGGDIAYNIEESDGNIIMYLNDGANKNGLKPDYDGLELFSLAIENLGSTYNYIQTKITVPANMTIDQIKLPGKGEFDGGVKITDANFNVTEGEYNANGSTTVFDLVQPITGGQTFTIKIYDIEPLTMNYDVSLNYRDSGLRFIGSVTGEEDDVLPVELSNKIYGSYENTSGQLKEEYITNVHNPDVQTLNLNVTDLQIPAVISNDYKYLDANGSVITSATLGDDVQLYSTVRIHGSYYYGTPFLELNSPTILLSVPPELTSQDAEFKLEDLTIYDGDEDLKSYVSNFEVVSGESGVYEGGKLIRIDLENYTLTSDTVKMYLDTKVDETLMQASIVDNTIGSVVVDTTDEGNYEYVTSGYKSTTLKSSAIFYDDNLNGVTQVANVPYTKLSINIDSAMGAKTFVDTNMDDGNDHLMSVTTNSTMDEYPTYYLGDEGVYQLQIYNTFDYNSEEPLYTYVVFPDLTEYGAMLDLENMTIIEDGSEITQEYYTTDKIDTTAGWEEQDDDNVNWVDTKPKGSCITALRFEFSELNENSNVIVKIPYTTTYAKTEDDSLYTNIIGQSIYSIGDHYSMDGPTAGVMVEKTEAPEIELMSLTDDKEYTYVEAEKNLISDMMDYNVTDDYTDELVVYDPNTDEFDDANTDDMASIDVTFKDSKGNETVYSEDEFNDLSTYLAGEYKITYKSEQDSDAQTAEKTVEVKVAPDDASIYANNITVKYSDVATNEEQLITDLGAVATEYDNVTDVSDTIKVSDYGTFAFDDYTLDTYTFELSAYGESENLVYTTVTMEVVADDTSITGSDALVQLEDAPTSLEELIELMNVEAIDVDSSDITDAVTLEDSDGYDLDAPAIGVYDITYKVTYSDGSEGTLTKVLTVKDNQLDDTGLEYSVLLIIIISISIIGISIYKKKNLK